MAYIHTSKTRRREPNGKTVMMDRTANCETRITDERGAEKLLRRAHSGWSEPRQARK